MANIRRKSSSHGRNCTASVRSRSLQRPTTRQIADLIRAGGADALTEATRRADAATYQEVSCRSALNRVKGMPFEWTLNPYRGCTHGCHYCYARRYHTQFELGADDEFASIIFVKTNFVDVLRRELQRPSWQRRLRRRRHRDRLLSADRGPLQADARARSRRSASSRNPVGVVTKGPMIVRDKDVLAGPAAARRLQRLHQRPDASTKTSGGSSNQAPRRRCSGCARFASWSTPASAPAC